MLKPSGRELLVGSNGLGTVFSFTTFSLAVRIERTC